MASHSFNLINAPIFNMEVLIDRASNAQNWVSVVEFCREYDIDDYSFRVLLGKDKKLTFGKYVKQLNGKNYINLKPLIRRQEFRKRIWLTNHDNYFILTENMRDYDLALILARYTGKTRANWAQFLSYRLFSLAFIEKSILDYKVPDNMWEFYRATTLIIRRKDYE